MKLGKIAASVAAISVVLGSAGLHAQEQAPRVFEQSGSWALDYGEDFCQLATTFANGEDEIALALERNRGENSVRLILVGDSIRTFRGADMLGYRYLPSGEDRSAGYIRSETPDGRAYFNLGTIAIGPDPFAGSDGGEALVLPPYDRNAELEYAAGITGIAFEEGLLRGITLGTGSLRAPIQALQGCMDDLLRDWGLDYEKHRTMSRRAAPVGPAWEWIPQGTVGFQDFAAFSGSRNPFRVMIDAEGSPTACQVHWPSLSERKNAAICNGIMENGTFTPALDAEGQPMASYWMVDYMFGLSRPFGR